MGHNSIIVHPRFRHTLPHTSRSNGCLTELGLDALRLVASNMSDDARNVLRFEQVSRLCRLAAGDEELWRRLCKNRFSVPDDANPGSWRALYRWNHEFFYKVILSYATDRLMQTRLNGLASGAAFNIAVLA